MENGEESFQALAIHQEFVLIYKSFEPQARHARVNGNGFGTTASLVFVISSRNAARH